MDLSLFDLSTLRLGDWAALTASLPRLALLAAIGMLTALALALLLTALFPPPEPPSRARERAAAAPDLHRTGAETPESGRVGDGRRGSAPESHGTGVETVPARPASPADVPATVGARASAAQAGHPLHGVGFSPVDVAALEALRTRVLDGEVSDAATHRERLAFARWLVEHGRLHG